MTDILEGRHRDKSEAQLQEIATPNLDADKSPRQLQGKLCSVVNTYIETMQKITSSNCMTCHCKISLSLQPKSWLQRRILTVLALKEALMQFPTETNLASVYIYHVALLEVMPLEKRRVQHVEHFLTKFSNLPAFFSTVILALKELLSDEFDYGSIRQQGICDIADLLDGRLLRSIAHKSINEALVPELGRRFAEIAHVLCTFSGIHVKPLCVSPTVGPTIVMNQDDHVIRSTMLRFSNPIFDNHLLPIKLEITSEATSNAESGRIFRELTHWHNAKVRFSEASCLTGDARL